jgi:hypothetical protein
MPFDAQNPSDVVDILDTVGRRFHSRYYNWVQHGHGDDLNDYLPPQDACLMDALKDVCPYGYEQALTFLADAIIDRPPGQPDAENEILIIWLTPQALYAVIPSSNSGGDHGQAQRRSLPRR